MNRTTALLLAVATGFAGLVYEIVWERYLAILLGSHAEATSAVLAIFLGGLAVGYILFGRISRRIAESEGAAARLLRAYGLVEIGIGVLGLLFPILFTGVRRLSIAIPHLGEAGSFSVDVFLTTILIGPATILMGATVPFLTQALTRTDDEATRTHALVYGLNTVGAFCGAVLAGYVLIPRYGLVGTTLAMGLVNVAAGAVYVALSGSMPGAVRVAPPKQVADDTQRTFILVAFLCGFAAMTLQTVVIRLAGLSFGSSPYTFAAVVATFVLCIAVGSLAVSLTGTRTPRWALPALLWLAIPIQFVMYQVAEGGPHFGHQLRALFQHHAAAFTIHEIAVFVAIALFIGPMALISGAVLPLLFDLLRGDRGELGEVAGRLYCWNTLGSLAGALLGGYALLFVLNLHHIFRLATASILAAAVLLTLRVMNGRARGLLLVAPAPILLVLLLAPAWAPEALSPGIFRAREEMPLSYQSRDAFVENVWEGRQLLFYDDDPAVTTLIAGYSNSDAVSLMTNGKVDGNTTGDYSTMSLIGLLPGLLADDPRRAFVIGWGTGITAAELAGFDSIQEVAVAEISSGVIRGREYFDSFNGGASRNPKIEIVRSDAYRALTRSDGKWDIIVSEPSNPWVTGVEMLYSQEFLETARDRLNDGGVYVQWLQGYEIEEDTVRLILRTYASVFSDLSVWFTSNGDYALIGRRSGEPLPELNQIVERFEDNQERFALAGVDTVAELLAHEVVPFGTLVETADDGPVHTLLHPRLNHLAVHDRFGGQWGFLPFSGWGESAKVGQERSLLRRYLQVNLDGRMNKTTWDEIATTLCSNLRPECGAMLAFWVAQVGEAQGLEAKAGQVYTRNGSLTQSDLMVASLLISASADAPPQVDVSGGEHVLELYHSLYNHTMPFSPDALRQTLSNCVPEKGLTVHDCDRLEAKMIRLLETGELDFGAPLAPSKLTVDSSGRSSATRRDAG